jgi:hypothetical protein
VIGARRHRLVVGPPRCATSQITGDDSADNGAVEAGGEITQGITAAKGVIPELFPKACHGHRPGKHQGPFLRGYGVEYLPLITYGEFIEQLGATDFFKIARHLLNQPLPLVIIGGGQAGVFAGIRVVDGPTKINRAANHADAGAIAQDVVRVFRFDPADDGKHRRN